MSKSLLDILKLYLSLLSGSNIKCPLSKPFTSCIYGERRTHIFKIPGGI